MIKQQDAVAALEKRFGSSLRAIYRVGLVDSSPLCDLDLVLVFETSVPPAAKLALPEADIRAVFTAESFAEAAKFLPYAEIVCIAGNPIAFAPAGPEQELVKISYMFFYAFTKNLYRLVGVTDEEREILTHLNDFEYALRWFEPSQSWLTPFVEQVRRARSRFPDVTDEETQLLLREGINHAWRLTAELDKALLAVPAALKPIKKWTKREVTYFLDATPDQCRAYTEKHRFAAERLKVTYLPINFARVVNAAPGSFAAEYVAKNLNKAAPCTHRYLREFAKRCLAWLL